MSSAELFRRVVAWLVSPLGLFAASSCIAWIAALLGDIEPRWVRRGTALLAAMCGLLLLALSCYPLGDAIAAPLEARARAMASSAGADRAAAVVVLLPARGAGVEQGAAPALTPVRAVAGDARPPERARVDRPPVVGAEGGHDRLLRAAQAWHDGAATSIVVSGGLPAATEVLQALGVPAAAIRHEAQAANLGHSLSIIAQVLGERRRVVLVTSAVAMPRAMVEARRAGLDPQAMPVDFRSDGLQRAPQERWLPTPVALEWSTLALREWLAMLASR